MADGQVGSEARDVFPDNEQNGDVVYEIEVDDMDPNNSARMSDPPEKALWYSHDRRIGRLEENQATLERCMIEIKSEQHRGNDMMQTLVKETKDIRDMIAGARVFGKIAGWGGGIAGALVSIYMLVQLIGKFAG
jgi:hypothetical protein